jgi:hypothetical protein
VVRRGAHFALLRTQLRSAERDVLLAIGRATSRFDGRWWLGGDSALAAEIDRYI